MSKNKQSHITRRNKRVTHKKHSHSYAKVYHPYLPGLLILISALFILLGSFSSVGSVLGLRTGISQENLLEETNNVRQSQNDPKLLQNSALDKAAQNKAEDMVARGYWSHETPEGKQPWIFIERTGYNYSVASENLAYGFSSSEQVINGWLNSPPHKEAMLSKSISDVGFGIARSSNFQEKGPATIVVAMYAKPAKTTSILASSTSDASRQSQNISFAKSSTKNGYLINFIAGLALGLSLMFLISKHTLKLRKHLKKTEKYILKHPALDFTILAIIVLCLALTKTSGFIY